MHTLTKIVGAACLIGAMAASSVVPAQAQGITFSYGNTHHNSYHGWNDSDWRWRQRHRAPRYNSGVSFGFSIDLSDRNMSSSHVRRCEDRYRSYSRRTDTYLGFDGERHYCNL